jgi:hypothetical protein
MYTPNTHKLKFADKLGQTPPNNNIDTDKLLAQFKTLFDDALNGASALQAGIGRVVDISNVLGNALITQTKNATALEQRYADLNKTFGVSSVRAAEFGQAIDEISSIIGVGGTTIIKYNKNLKDLGIGYAITMRTAKDSTNKFQQSLLLGQRAMVTNMGITEKASEGYEYYAATIADSGVDQLLMQGKIAESIERATGMTGVQRDLTETIGNLTADLQLQYSKIPGSLELAILKSRALGMSMADLNKTGKALLNIESSIGDEIEYQLISGRRLVDEQSGESLTNAFRMAVVQRDSNKQAEIMNQILQQEGELLNNNYFAREQMSKLLGIDEATLARSLQKQEIMQKLGAEFLMKLKPEDFDKELAKLKQDATTKGEAERLQLIEQLTQANDTRTTDQKMLEEIEKLNSNIVAALVKTMEKKPEDRGKGAGILVQATDVKQRQNLDILDEFSKVLSDVSFARFIGGAQQVAVATTSLGTPLLSLTSVFNGLTGALSPFLNAISPVGSAISKIAGMASVPVTQRNDAVIQFNPVTMHDGVIQFNPADKFMQVNDSTMIAGTNVNGNQALANAITQNTGGGMSDQQISKLATSIAMAMKNVTLTVEAPLGSATGMNGGTWS